MKQDIQLIVNHVKYNVDVDPWDTLLFVLREKLGLLGTKYGCGTGDCGACTVIVDGETYNSCMLLAIRLQGKHILTVEGLSRNGEPHPLQQAFIEIGAIQCGYCTPGMLMSAKALLDQNPSPTHDEIKTALAGNICRCTGYKKITEAILSAAEILRSNSAIIK